MRQSERTQIMIIMNKTSGTITNSRLSLIHTKENTTWLWRWIFLWRVVSGIHLSKARREWDKPLSSIVNLLATDLALWGLSRLLQHSLGYEGFWRLNHSAPSSMDEGYIYRGDEEVEIPTIVEGRPYPLGGFPIRWKQEAKGGRSWLFSWTTSYDSSTKLLWSKLHLFF